MTIKKISRRRRWSKEVKQEELNNIKMDFKTTKLWLLFAYCYTFTFDFCGGDQQQRSS